MPDAASDRKRPSSPALISNVGSMIADMAPLALKLRQLGDRGVLLDAIFQRTKSRVETDNDVTARLTGKSNNQSPLVLARPVTLCDMIRGVVRIFSSTQIIAIRRSKSSRQGRQLRCYPAAAS